MPGNGSGNEAPRDLDAGRERRGDVPGRTARDIEIAGERMTHIGDCTKIFATPDELAEFLMLDAREQDRVLIELMHDRRLVVMMRCCRFE